MGINFNAGISHLLMSKHSYKDYIGKSILMLGVQDLSVNGVDLMNISTALGFEISPDYMRATNKEKFRDFDSYKLFRWIGFDIVHAMDVSDYEGADIIWDLNAPIPKELYRQYDYIYDGGTLEHVFNTRQALENLARMLKPKGVIVHDLPAAKLCNHGFYTFSPTLFTDFYCANGFRIDSLHLFCRQERGNESVQYRSVDCRLFDPLQMLRMKLDNQRECALIVCIATKIEEVEEYKTPIQGMYMKMYGHEGDLLRKEISYTFEWVKKQGYRRIAIYGMKDNACLLYEMFSNEEDVDVFLIRGEGDEKLSFDENKYRLYDVELSPIDNIDCVIIGSFRYADEIMKRLRKDIKYKGVEIVNMLDI